MQELKLPPNEYKVLDSIYNIEESKINIGIHEFVSDKSILEVIGIENESVLPEILDSLKKHKLIILIDNQATQINDDPKVKWLVRSKIGHIIWCLQNSKNIHNFDNREWNPNVADLKYLKFIKEISDRNKILSTIIHDQKFRESIDVEELNSKSGGLLTAIIESFSKKYSVSDFQYKAINEILHGIKNRHKNYNAQGLVIVAGTGAGKSLAYQIPLIIWIIAKKIKKYNDSRNIPDTKLWTNCSGLLLFPRVVLAKDQFQNFQSEIDEINSIIENWRGIDENQKEFLKIKIKKDFGGPSREEIRKTYVEEQTDIIVTNTDTLKRRLYNPIASSFFKYGIDLVLFDEIHLYEGLQGSYVSGLNGRLANLTILSHKLDFKGKPPFFVGISATIDKPDKHCQKLFALKEKPMIIDDDLDIKKIHSTEHHVIIKPRLGRPPLGVAIDTTSCLIHNRRDGLVQYHTLPSNDEERKKSITFIDSLDGTARFTNYLNNFEFYDFPRSTPVRQMVRRYPVNFKPAQRDNTSDICDNCVSGESVQVGVCPYYLDGNCWYFSQDNANTSWWIRKITNEVEYPRDNIRSKRVTAQEVNKQSGDVSNYDYFIDRMKDYGYPRRTVELNERIDNLVATQVLEVGVDFKGISEIILYGNVGSPAAYKQRAGRGAREGNLEDGLFVMSVIQNSPLANFYFRHFKRLVYPHLGPVKLEVRNSDIMKSQCFASIFDYFASRGVELYKVKESDDEDKEDQRIREQYSKALEIIDKRNSLEEYLERFLRTLDFQDKTIINSVITEVLKLITQLTQPIKIGDKTKSLIAWMSLSPTNPDIQMEMEEKFTQDHKEEEENEEIITQIQKELKLHLPEFKKIIEKEIPDHANLMNMINKYEEENLK